jgi:hypothetical protein
MTTLLKNPITYLFLIIAGLVIYIMIRPTSSNSDVKIISDERKYDSLQVVNTKKMDSLATYYDKKIDSIKILIGQYSGQISQNNQAIKSVQDAYNKKVPVINSYDVDSLNSYFSNYQQQSH